MPSDVRLPGPALVPMCLSIEKYKVQLELVHGAINFQHTRIFTYFIRIQAATDAIFIDRTATIIYA